MSVMKKNPNCTLNFFHVQFKGMVELERTESVFLCTKQKSATLFSNIDLAKERMDTEKNHSCLGLKEGQIQFSCSRMKYLKSSIVCLVG